MKKPTQPPSTSRREFLRQCAVVGGSATVVVAAGGVAADTPVDDPTNVAAAEPAPQGYRVTDHIREYYEKAGI